MCWKKNAEGKDGVRFNFHAGQRKAWASTKRTILLLAGSRAGKTSFAACWLYREMKDRGAGDYLIAAPSYQLIDKAAGPTVTEIFQNFFSLGTMGRRPWRFTVSKEGEKRLWGAEQDKPTRIIFGHADDPDSLEAMQIKAAWLDEAGQTRFRPLSWEAIRYRRLAIDKGRAIISTTPYNLGWLKSQIYDPWKAANENHPEIDVFQFSSLLNPAFDREEYERAERALPQWRFNMMFRGLFTKPAGIIYEAFDPDTHVIPAGELKAAMDGWPRYLGLDFGGVNTAAVFVARNPENGNLVVYREYRKGNASAAEHCYWLQKDEPPFEACAGGSRSEGQWRREFATGGATPQGVATGLQIHSPGIRGIVGVLSEVEVGISRVNGAFKRDQLSVSSDCQELLDELATYSRVLNDRLEPTEEIEAKETFHHLDSLRYIIGYLMRSDNTRIEVLEPTKETASIAENLDRAASKIAAELPTAQGGAVGKIPTQEEWDSWNLRRYMEGKSRYADDEEETYQDGWAEWR